MHNHSRTIESVTKNFNKINDPNEMLNNTKLLILKLILVAMGFKLLSNTCMKAQPP